MPFFCMQMIYYESIERFWIKRLKTSANVGKASICFGSVTAGHIFRNHF